MRFLFYLIIIFASYSQVACRGYTPYNFFASQAYYSNCDFTPFFLYNGVRLHRRQQEILFVSDELFGLAKEANELLSTRIGITLFEIRHITDSGNGSEVYISTNEVHYESEKKLKEPNSYLAYCSITENFSKKTGEIYESDIVFNPILWDKPRELSRDWKKSLRENERRLEQYEQRIKDLKNNPHADSHTTAFLKKQLKEWETLNEESESDLDKFKDSIYLKSLETMIHEMGHALGYQHTPGDIENIMYNKIRGNRRGTVLTGHQVNAVLCAFGLPSNTQ